jgi:hypothetical protein
MIDWRANRLVDMLAKAAADALQCSVHVQKLLPSADAAVAHAACLLGVVTHVANHCAVTVVVDGGGSATRFARDSVDKPKIAANDASDDEPVALPVAAPVAAKPMAPPRVVKPWAPPSFSLQAKRDSEDVTARRVKEIGDALGPSSTPPAAALMGSLLERIRAFEARATPPPSRVGSSYLGGSCVPA